jgi:hypothetical protein
MNPGTLLRMAAFTTTPEGGNPARERGGIVVTGSAVHI